ncbi:MAG TPA: GNAT family N-acetyltransferase, partial [Candidatus Limnocylindrales bacterium]
CTPDHAHAEGFVALAPDGRLAGHLCLEPAGAGRVELAVAVADEWQRRGIGRALFEAALDWAHRQRLAEIVASAYADNGPVLRLLSSAPYPATVSPAEAGTVNVTIPLVAPLPSAWRLVPAPGGRTRRRGSRRAAAPARGRCRVFWRRTPPPARGAAG